MAATSDNHTLARPYARALFEMAQARGSLADWGDNLDALAAVVSHDDVAGLIGNPGVEQQKLAGEIAAIAKTESGEARNFVSLLAENKRIDLLPAIAEQFGQQRATAEGWVEVEVTSASQIDAELQARLAESLKHKLGREVRIQTDVDEELIGGAVIRAGDLVIDGSVRSQLERMQQVLSR